MQWNVSIEIYPFRPYVTSSAFLKCWKFQREYFRCIISHHIKSKKLTSALASCWYALRSSFVLFRFVKLWKKYTKIFSVNKTHFHFRKYLAYAHMVGIHNILLSLRNTGCQQGNIIDLLCVTLTILNVNSLWAHFTNNIFLIYVYIHFIKNIHCFVEQCYFYINIRYLVI